MGKWHRAQYLAVITPVCIAGYSRPSHFQQSTALVPTYKHGAKTINKAMNIYWGQ